MCFLSIISTEHHTSKYIISVYSKSLPSWKSEEAENIYFISCKWYFADMTLWDVKDIGSHYQGWWRQQQHTNELEIFLILY